MYHTNQIHFMDYIFISHQLITAGDIGLRSLIDTFVDDIRVKYSKHKSHWPKAANSVNRNYR